MSFEQVERISYNKNPQGRPDSKTVFSDVIKYLPNDLLIGITILLQDTGYITIRPIKLARMDWSRLDRSVKKMGGIWVSSTSLSHWSIPLTRLNQ
ncbi:MAG: hypothetical protein ABSA11_01790 [Candidatus Bathyarchaeia archaeon]